MTQTRRIYHHILSEIDGSPALADGDQIIEFEADINPRFLIVLGKDVSAAPMIVATDEEPAETRAGLVEQGVLVENENVDVSVYRRVVAVHLNPIEASVLFTADV